MSVQKHRAAQIVGWAMAFAIGTEIGRPTMPSVLAQSYEKVQQNLQNLQGTWRATKAKRNGLAVADVIGHRLTFTGKRFQLRSQDGKAVSEGTFSLDLSVEPPDIDFHHQSGGLKGKTWRGIYTLEGDVLKICDNSPDLEKPRPVEFEAQRDSGHVLITFGRVNLHSK